MLSPSVVFFYEKSEIPNSFGLETRRVDGTGVYAEIKGCGEKDYNSQGRYRRSSS